MRGAFGPKGVKWPRSWAFRGWQVEVATMAHLVEKDTLVRANAALLQTLVCGGLIVCALGAVVFDIGRAIAIW
jgi:hypothetical protein